MLNNRYRRQSDIMKIGVTRRKWHRKQTEDFELKKCIEVGHSEELVGAANNHRSDIHETL